MVGVFFLGAQTHQVYDFFEDVSLTYAKINDYKARISIQSRGQDDLIGTLFVKGKKIRIDFNSGEVLSVGDGRLVVYDPNSKIVLDQTMASGRLGSDGPGLSLLKKYYKYSYYSPEGYKIIPLEDRSHEQVVKLRFDSKSGGLEFRNMVISFTSDNLIRRIVGNTFSGNQLIFDFTNVQINKGIPDNTFKYEIPGNAHAVRDFIYTPDK